MELVYSLLVALAAYRVWRIFALDKIAERPREWLMGKEDDSSAWRFVADLMFCPWCWGFWLCVAGAWVVAELKDYNEAQFALIALASSALTGLVRRLDP